MDYRPELDGLRAVAVVPVMLFHLGFPYLPGGFLGVDVFFVLSGFLIARQIAQELAENRFSLLSFYDRRIKRLLPALFAMLSASLAVGLLVLLPRDLENFGESLLAAALSMSNFHFWSKSDYFAPAAETMPLLHTWSLAVEEQFYLIFPLLLMMIWRFGRACVLLCILALTVSSFAANALLAASDAPTAFYLLPTRAWELLLGALLALAPGFLPRAGWMREAAAGVGLGIIALAMIALGNSTSFPGIATTLASLGCALVIWAGQNAFDPNIGQSHRYPFILGVLRWRPLVFIGLISYSLYLWHWPLIVFTRYMSTEPATHAQNALVLGATFLIASASFKFIEQPFRRGERFWPTWRWRVGFAAAVVAAFAVAGYVLDAQKGFRRLQAKEVLAALDNAKDRSPIRKRCHIHSTKVGELDFADTCTYGASSPRKIIIMGDSHAHELGYGLSELASAANFHLRLISAAGCPPIESRALDLRPGCPRHVRNMMKALAEHPPATVILASFYFHWTRPENPRRHEFWAGLDRTVGRLRAMGHRVVLLGGWPPYTNGDLPLALAKRLKHGLPTAQHFFPIDDEVSEAVEANLRGISSRHGATFVPLLEAVCGDARQCRAWANGRTIYFDDDHLTATLAKHIAEKNVLPALSNLGQATNVELTGSIK